VTQRRNGEQLAAVDRLRATGAAPDRSDERRWHAQARPGRSARVTGAPGGVLPV